MAYWPDNVIAIPLRGEQCVLVANIPHDFTDDEALKVAAVIEAFVNEAPEPPAMPTPKVSSDYARGYRAGMRRGGRSTSTQGDRK
jgi:hypothetical protein